MSYREELVQSAAVIVAMIEDFDYGSADANRQSRSPLRKDMSYVLADVAEERFRQDEKWGPQQHDPQTWLAILMEEVGEAAQAALDELIFPKAEAA